MIKDLIALKLYCLLIFSLSPFGDSRLHNLVNYVFEYNLGHYEPLHRHTCLQ